MKLPSVKAANKLLKNNRSAAAITSIMPVMLYFVIKVYELMIRRYFFPKYRSFLREWAVILFIIIVDFILLYPVIFAKKTAFYNNCLGGGISAGAPFCAYTNFSRFFVAAGCVGFKFLTIFTAALALVFPAFLLTRYCFENGVHVALQVGSIIVIMLAVFAVFVIYLSLFLTEYLAAEYGKNPFWCAAKSYSMMQGKRCELVRLYLRVLWMRIASLAVISSVFFSPLINQITALFAYSIISSRRADRQADNEAGSAGVRACQTE